VSAENNQFGIDYAYPGLCSFCHTEVADFDGSIMVRAGAYRPKITKLKAIYREMTVELDDGSKMRVPMCSTCFKSIGPSDYGELMESEINGWQAGVTQLTGWDDDHKRSHMKRYSNRFVKDRVDRRLTDDEKRSIKKPKKSKLKVRI